MTASRSRLPIMRVLAIFVAAHLLIAASVPHSASAGAATQPILLLVNDSGTYKFGRYLGEILRAEGLNAFDILDINSAGTADLEAHAVTILAQTGLTPAQASMLSGFVANGGRLLAMRPDPLIANLFGLNSPQGVMSEGYLGIEQDGLGQGLHSATLQFHGNADLYGRAANATAIAWLYTNTVTKSMHPAVIANESGGGRAVAFTYDLATSIVLMRQGNPANALVGNPPGDADDDGIVRTTDLFVPASGSVPWVDLSRLAIAQGDEQQRLFARLVENLATSGRQTMPQLWYFPGSAKTLLVLTSDAHGNQAEQYQTVIDRVSAYGGKTTFYLSLFSEIFLPNEQLLGLQSQGFEFGIHPWPEYDDPDPRFDIHSIAEGYQVFDDWFSRTYTAARSRTVRNHQVAWAGWTDAAELEVAHGIAMNTDFYAWGPWLQKTDGTWAHGNITGSGQPMKFIKADGTILPLYQQATQLVDEQLFSVNPGAPSEGLAASEAIGISRQLIDASLAGNYSALTAQFHVDHFDHLQVQPWAEGTMAYAESRQVPIWSADDWLRFTEVRHDANFEGIQWDENTGVLSFTLASQAQSGIALTTMLPLYVGTRGLQWVTVDGVGAPWTLNFIKGRTVVFVTVPAGAHTFAAVYQEGAANLNYVRLPVILR